MHCLNLLVLCFYNLHFDFLEFDQSLSLLNRDPSILQPAYIISQDVAV